MKHHAKTMQMSNHAQQRIEQLQLQPHPEGGFYREMHRASQVVQSSGHAGSRHAYTTIYFLLPSGHHSAWHRVASDETWFSHEGCAVALYLLSPERGQIERQELGSGSGQFQFTVKANQWFAARPVAEASFCLVSCAVGPGFTFDDFELATDEQMTQLLSAEDRPLGLSLLAG